VELRGEGGEFLLRESAGTNLGAMPGDEVVIRSETDAAAEVGDAAGRDAEEAVGAVFQESGQDAEDAVIAVAQEQVAVPEARQELPEEAHFAGMKGSAGEIQERAGEKAEEGYQAQDGKAAAAGLGRGLGVGALILRRIGHGDGGAIDGEETQAAPEGLRVRLGLGLERLSRLAHQASQEVFG
jgi:hypothetical protein